MPWSVVPRVPLLRRFTVQLISTLAVYRGNKANHSQVSVAQLLLVVDIPNCTLPRRRLSDVDLSIFENAGQEPGSNSWMKG